MADEFPGRRLLLIGLCIAALGIVLNFLTGLVSSVFPKLLDFWGLASIGIDILGSFVAFLGGVIWACTADGLKSVALWAVGIGVFAFVAAEVLGVGLMSPAAILLPVFFAAALTAAFALAIAAVRFVWARLVT